MITLTTPIAVPNITRVRVTEVALFDASSTARIKLQVLSPGGTPRAKDFEILVTNGATADDTSSTLAINATTSAFDGDVVPGGRLRVVNGYDQVEAAYRAAANKAAAFRAVETLLLSLNLLPSQLGGTVS